MTFGAYIRCEGWVAVVTGAALCLYGGVQGHQGPVDAALSGVIMIVGTGLFMAFRHRVPLRAPGAWFTSTPLSTAGDDRAPCRRRGLMFALLAQSVAATAMVVGLSVLTGFWLTYVDVGVWAVAIGAIKIGPASAAIAEHEARSGMSYRVARRPWRGMVQLTAAAPGAPRLQPVPTGRHAGTCTDLRQ
jgi:hypothetical protein